jgi:hypothetical protein
MPKTRKTQSKIKGYLQMDKQKSITDIPNTIPDIDVNHSIRTSFNPGKVANNFINSPIGEQIYNDMSSQHNEHYN